MLLLNAFQTPNARARRWVLPRRGNFAGVAACDAYRISDIEYRMMSLPTDVDGGNAAGLVPVFSHSGGERETHESDRNDRKKQEHGRVAPIRHRQTSPTLDEFVRSGNSAGSRVRPSIMQLCRRGVQRFAAHACAMDRRDVGDDRGVQTPQQQLEDLWFPQTQPCSVCGAADSAKRWQSGDVTKAPLRRLSDLGAASRCGPPGAVNQQTPSGRSGVETKAPRRSGSVRITGY